MDEIFTYIFIILRATFIFTIWPRCNFIAGKEVGEKSVKDMPQLINDFAINLELMFQKNVQKEKWAQKEK